SIFHQDGTSCASAEITVTGFIGETTPVRQMYTDCGAQSLRTTTDGATWWGESAQPNLVQQGDFACRNDAPWTSANCWLFPTDTWITLYFKIHVGTWEAQGSTIEASYAVDGQPYKKWINVVKNFTLHCNDTAPCPGQVFNNLTLTPYMTALSKAAPATAYVW